MSRVPGSRGSLQGLRRRIVGVDPKSSTEDQEALKKEEEEEVIFESPSEDSMDDVANVELGRKPSASSNGSQSDEEHIVEDEPRCDEALLKCENEVRFQNEQKSDDEQEEEGDSNDTGSQREYSSEQTAEYKDSADDNNSEDSVQEDVATPQEGDGEHEKVDESQCSDKEDKENKEDSQEDDEDGASDEENEIKIPLKVKVYSRTGSGRNSPVDSELDVECVYLPTSVVVAAGHLRETAGHLREQAGHLREQLGEQAEHLREQLGEQAGQIVQFGGQIRDQVGEQAQKVVVQAERVVHKVKDVAWRVTHHNLLPEWLKDNDFLHYHHRPPLPSFRSCFKSIFRIHTETGNIWTHMIGCVTFLIMMIYFLVTSILSKESWQVIVVYMAFFIGAITCLGFSCLFHTCSCHSDKVAKIFSKLDYSGISLLIVGSFIPWLYFGFYCESIPRWFYISLIIVLGTMCLMVALKDKFAQPRYRPIRAGLFIALGLSAVIPAIHFLILKGFVEAFTRGSLGWMIFMGSLYIGGALLYAMRIPERFFPGKCDLMVQSHQIFHVMVVAAAFVHYHGLNVMAVYREQTGECMSDMDEGILPYTSGAA